MTKKLTVIIKKDSLNKNLLNLALAGLENETRFMDPSELNSQTLKISNWVVVDDGAYSSPEELEKNIKKMDIKKRIIFLVHNKEYLKLKNKHPSWFFLTKPFDPQTLLTIIGNKQGHSGSDGIKRKKT